ncbi:DNA-binding IclR family transcriptional regulator [Mycobacterium frederiksbergense]|uniref:DNA-binding IclR family transcriptional regulator n=1 Tax=Mycolicibacterium frederiksbergense TaxID=117567 RepID=A0ABT6L590_9MYCO|nr:IclR family transcriptional regulator [Mycolicibacterium frederiksbergense]MDH6198099.1 DNA-binding IclR family transcriptional regulator [Mycolicibacterium frederiksbergense]
MSVSTGEPSTTAQAASTIPNSVLGKAFSILSAFDDESDTLRLVDLSQRSGVPKPSVYRLAQELVSLGMLERSGNAYRIGFNVFALSQRVSSASLLHKVGRPVLVDLVAMTRGTAHLAVLDGTGTYYLEKLGGTRSVHALSRVGGHLPLTCTASGKLLLAMSPRSDQLLDEVLADRFPRLTPHSPHDRALLRREMDTIRSNRLATEREETLMGFKSFAVPIYDGGDEAIAALSLTVPISHTGDTALVKTLRLASAGITRQHTRLAMNDAWDRRHLA